MPRILYICTKYGRGAADRYLTNELVDALAALGCTVSVIVLDWDSPPRPALAYVQENGVDVLMMAPVQVSGAGSFVRLVSKWLGSSFIRLSTVRKHLAGGGFDLVVALSPLTATTAILWWAIRRFRCRSYAYLVDFFPFHHHSAGVFPGGLALKVGRWLETTLCRRFDVIGCMTAKGTEYFRRHYAPGEHQRIEVLPLWGPVNTVEDLDRCAIRRTFALPQDRPIAVFGGQITEGRGIEEILHAAKLAKARKPELLFLFVGRGRLEPLVRRYIDEDHGNVMLKEHIDRDRYLSLIASCDVAIVATVANVDVPTFPSKTIDYLRASVPIAAAVEATTDYGDFVRQHGFGLAIEAGDPSALLDAILTIVENPGRAAAMRVAGEATLRSIFDVRRAAERLLEQTGQAS